MSAFASLMRRADTLRRVESDPLKDSWWTGYLRGLRRAHHGELFGSLAEHELWLAAISSSDESRAALGRGYRAGLTLEARDPSGDTLTHCVRCERYVVAFAEDGDLVCTHCKLVL